MDRLTARSLIYNVFSLCFLYPNEKVYTSIAEGEWIIEFKDALHLLDGNIIDDHISAIEQALSGVKEGEQRVMSREYTRLFVNAFPYVLAPPYGSIYLERTGVVSANITPEVLRFYHEAGFTLKENLHDVPDHIVHELEFMGRLASEESRASGNEKIKLEETQMKFMARFILPWVPTFCKRVTEQSRYPFYHYLANLTKEFVNFETNYLGVPEELNSLKEYESETSAG